MKESMPSRVQPVQAAQKPVICPGDSWVCGCAAADAATSSRPRKRVYKKGRIAIERKFGGRQALD
jgi:hypothetical protein